MSARGQRGHSTTRTITPHTDRVVERPSVGFSFKRFDINGLRLSFFFIFFYLRNKILASLSEYEGKKPFDGGHSGH